MRALVLGSGMMGKGAAFDLCRQPDLDEVILADMDINRAEEVKREVGCAQKIRPEAFSANDENRVAALMEGCNTAIGATSYDHNYLYSKVAIDKKCNFIDLGGNNDVVDRQFTLSDKAKETGIAIIPDCGLAPGLVNILAGRAATRFDAVHSIKIRVGGVPVNPKPPLNYFLVFSARGLINEYIEKARILENGEIKEVESMEGLETLHFQDPFCEMEAFYTSGGTSTLPTTMRGKVPNLDYKTIRYPGHQHYIKFLMDMGLMSSEPFKLNGHTVTPRNVLEKILEINLKRDDHDAILVRVIADGVKNGIETVYTQEIVDFFDKENDLTSMMRMTAFPASILSLMLARNDIKDKGVLNQEISVPYEKMMEEMAKRKITVSTRKQQL